MNFKQCHPKYESYKSDEYFVNDLPDGFISALEGFVLRYVEETNELKHTCNELARMIPCETTSNWGWDFLLSDFKERLWQLGKKKFEKMMDFLGFLTREYISGSRIDELNEFLSDYNIGYVAIYDNISGIIWNLREELVEISDSGDQNKALDIPILPIPTKNSSERKIAKVVVGNSITTEAKIIENDFADIGLICITPTEIAAVMDTMKEMDDYREDQRFTFYSAKMKGDACDFRIGFTAAISQGNVSITSALHALIEKYRPKLIVLVGMAGGIHKDVQLCDVVIGDEIFYYEPTKSRAGGNSHRGASHKIHPHLLRLLTHFQARYGYGRPIFKSTPGSPKEIFTVYVGPIGTGEEVVGYKNAETREWLQKVNDKTLVVETESWGVANTLYEASAWPHTADNSIRGTLVFRGVADHADQDKGNDLQYCATKNALTTLIQFLKMIKHSDIDF